MGRITYAWAIILTAALSGHLWAGELAFDPKTMLPVSEIQPGMRAVGKSVFSGTKIVEFGVELIGVLAKSNSGEDLILGRILDGPVTERNSGVVAGMSGSPVYVGGRLVGAISMAWMFEKEPIAGITPISSMLRAYDPAHGLETAHASAAAPEGVLLAGRRITQARIVSLAEAARRPFVDDHTIAMAPVSPLIVCAGLSEAGMARLRATLGPLGAEPVQGPGAMRNPVDTELAPGSAVAVQLASGDFDISGVGTVTYRRGDTILAFGHSMLTLGDVAIPMATAWVHDFVPAYSNSTKLASAMKTVGTMTRDGEWAVGGSIGKAPVTVPVTVSVTDADRAVTRQYRVQVARQRLLSASIVESVVLSALAASYQANQEGTVRLRFTVEGEDGCSVTREDSWSHPGSVEMSVAMPLDEALTIVTRNRFRPQAIKSVTVSATLDSVDRVAQIEKLTAEQPVVKAGETLRVRVVLRPNGGERFEQILQVPIPIETPKGVAQIAVAGGEAGLSLRARLGMLLPEVESLQDLVDVYEGLDVTNELCLGVALPSQSVGIGRHRLTNLPSSYREALSDSSRTDLQLGRSGQLTKVSTEYLVSGQQMLTLPVEDRRGEKGSAPGAKAGGTPGSSGLSKLSGPGGLEFGDEGDEFTLPGRKSLWWAASALLPGEGGPAPRYTQVPSPPAGYSATEGPGPDIAADGNAEAGAEAKTDDSAEAESETEAAEDDGQVIARQSSVWAHAKQGDFAGGRAAGVAARSDGALTLTAPWLQGPTLPEAYTLCFHTAPDGQVYVGTADRARVYRLGASEPQLVLDTDEFGIACMASLPDGSILAGSIPHGRIFRIAPDGKGSILRGLDDQYVWALQPSADGSVLVGTGPHGRLYRLTADGEASVIARLPEAHITSFARLGEETYLGTAGGGAVYRLGSDGIPRAVVEAAQDDVTALAAWQGAIYLCTGGKGYVYRIETNGATTQVAGSGDDAFLALAQAGDSLYAAGPDEASIISVFGDDTWAVVHTDTKSRRVTALGAGADGKAYAGLGGPARILVADAPATLAGSYTSKALDAGRPSRWGQARWWAEASDGASISLRTRSGETDHADDGSWSAWSAPIGPGESIYSPPGRFLQYRVEMTRPSAAATPPRARRIALAYLPANRRPTVTAKQPADAAAIREEYELKWETKDPDKDSVETAIYLRPTGVSDWERIAGPTTESSYELDTTTHEDGQYELRFVATDLPSNPEGALEHEAIVREVLIDNTAPRLRTRSPARRAEDGGIVVEGEAVDLTSPVTAVLWQVEGGSVWRAAAPADGLYGDRFERWTIRTGPLPDGAERILIRARDAAGNTTDDKVTIPVPAGKGTEAQAESAEEAAATDHGMLERRDRRVRQDAERRRKSRAEPSPGQGG